MVTKNVAGIDYHERVLQVAVQSMDGCKYSTMRCRNDVEEVVRFISSVGGAERVALEACTGSAKFADELRAASGWKTQLCHPGYVQRMKNNPDKSDKSDAYLICDLTRVNYLPEVWLAPPQIRDLRTLVRYREHLVQGRKTVKIKLRALLRNERIRIGEVRLRSKRGVEALRQAICKFPEHGRWVFEDLLQELGHAGEKVRRCEARFAQVAANDWLVRQLMEESGVGLITAVVIRAEIGTFTRFRKGKQLAKFCGLSPCNVSSAEKQADSGLIQAGNSVLKRCLIQAGHVLCRHHPRWKELRARLLSAGKPYSVMLAAVVNRWLRELFHRMVAFETSGNRVAA